MERRRGARAAGVILGVFVLTSSCRQILGTDDYRVRSDGGTARGSDASDGARHGKITYASSACEACIERDCRAERQSCEADAACLDYASCAYGCTTQACFADCYQASRDPGAARTLMACAVGHCAADCVPCGAALQSYGPTCVDCIAQDTGPGGACALMEECYRDPGCLGYATCMVSECSPFLGSEPRCRLSCGMKQPEGARTFYQAFGTRYFLGCGQACGGGKQWDCPQPAVWPPVSSPGSLATVRFRGPATQVKGCALSDPACTRPIDAGPLLPREAATGEAEAVLALPPVTTTGAGYYFEMDDPTGTFASVLFVPVIPVPGDLTLWSRGALDPAVLTPAAALRGEAIDRSLPGLEVIVTDCVGGLADFYSVTPEITVTASAGGPPYYSAQGAFSATQAGGGQAVFVNLPAGVVALTVRRGQSIIAEAPNVPLRPAGFTVVAFNYPQFF